MCSEVILVESLSIKNGNLEEFHIIFKNNKDLNLGKTVLIYWGLRLRTTIQILGVNW